MSKIGFRGLLHPNFLSMPPPKTSIQTKPGSIPLPPHTHPTHRRGAAADTSLPWREQYGAAALAALLFALWQYGRHANWASSEAYSSPSIVLISGYGANRYVLDDFR